MNLLHFGLVYMFSVYLSEEEEIGQVIEITLHLFLFIRDFFCVFIAIQHVFKALLYPWSKYGLIVPKCKEYCVLTRSLLLLISHYPSIVIIPRNVNTEIIQLIVSRCFVLWLWSWSIIKIHSFSVYFLDTDRLQVFDLFVHQTYFTFL